MLLNWLYKLALGEVVNWDKFKKSDGLFTSSWIFKLKLGPCNKGFVCVKTVSSCNSIWYATESATLSTTHNLFFTSNSAGKGSYSLIKTPILLESEVSIKALLAITNLLSPKFKKKSL